MPQSEVQVHSSQMKTIRHLCLGGTVPVYLHLEWARSAHKWSLETHMEMHVNVRWKHMCAELLTLKPGGSKNIDCEAGV